MNYVIMAVMGLIVGALAKLLYIGDNGNSWIMSMVLGIAGSFIAGLIGSMLDKQPGTQLKPARPRCERRMPVRAGSAPPPARAIL